jgi:hypothetical protein
MLLTHFIWQTVLKPLSGTNAKNGAITPSLTPTIHTIHARCYKASECGDVHFCVQLPVSCLLILQCLCVHQMVGRWICVCVSVCVRAPHKRLSARAFALTARKKRRLTSEPQSRRGERLPRDSRQEDDCDCTRHGHGRPKATRRPSRSARLPGIRTLGQGLDR